MLEETEGPKMVGRSSFAHDEAKKLFKDLDQDGDGTITMDEFVVGYMRWN